MGNTESTATNVEVEEKSFNWSISNFSMCPVVESKSYLSGDITWKLVLYPRGRDENLDERDRKFEIFMSKESKYNTRHLVKANVNLLNPASSEASGIPWEGRDGRFLCYSCRRQDMVNRKDLFFPNDVLTVHCYVKAGKVASNTWNEDQEIAGRDSELAMSCLKTVSSDFKVLYNSRKYCDVSLHLGNTEFQAHKAILSARSSVFADVFKANTSSSVRIENTEASVFDKVLQYIYTGNIVFESEGKPRCPKVLRELYAVSDRYGLSELKRVVKKFIMCDLNFDNVFEFIRFAHVNKDDDLWLRLKEYFHSHEIMSSIGWSHFADNNKDLVENLMSP